MQRKGVCSNRHAALQAIQHREQVDLSAVVEQLLIDVAADGFKSSEKGESYG